MRRIYAILFVIMLSDAVMAQPPGVTLDTLQVSYVDGHGNDHRGTIICNAMIAADLREIFAELYRQRYPIERISPASAYDNDDERQMRANNTSCYCYRKVAGTRKLSKHARGLAIDINPLYNPCVRRRRDGTLWVQPATAQRYANRKASFPYKITENDLCYRLFRQHGFTWGGHWRTLKDYQHFEK